MADLIPLNGASLRRVNRGTQQVLAHQDQAAMVRARGIQNITFVTEVAMFAVAGLSNLEGELIKQVPLAEPRLNAIVNSATGVIASQIVRFAQDLG